MKFTNNKNGLIWYHALCLDMLLDTSFTIVSYETCENFYTEEISTLRKDGHQEARARFYANLLLWNIRHKIHEMAEVLMINLATCFSIEGENSFNNTFTTLRVLEILTIQLSDSIVDRNMILFEFYDKELQSIIKLKSSASKYSNFFAERLELHRIHFELVKKFDVKHLCKLDKLMEMALKSKNHCAYDIIRHSKSCWKHELRRELYYFWINHSTKTTELNFHKLMNIDNRIFPYSLPIPKSGNF